MELCVFRGLGKWVQGQNLEERFENLRYVPSWHGPDCPPVVVIVGGRTVWTVLLS